MKNYRKILCATDFSRNCRAAAERAAEMAGRYDAKLTLLHVVEYFPEDRSNDAIAPEDADPEVYRTEKALASLAKLADELGHADAAREVAFTTGSARHAIVDFAREHSADLIVIATHGRHGLAHILGGTAYGVMHGAPCDVLAVRAKF